MSGICTVIISIWVCATIGTMFSKKSECFEYALISTFLIGLGYFLKH